MIVHVTGSLVNADDDIVYLRRIAKTVKQSDSSLARDWIESAYAATHTPGESDPAKPDHNWELVMDETLDAISKADVVIVEATYYTFSQGFQMAVALNLKKPVLVVSRLPFKDRLISGFRSRDSRMAEYDSEASLDDVVTQFLRANTISTKDLRFNMFIDRPIYNYLRSVSYETGKNKSEIIRELINREIRKKD
jgi:hypothetical protein